MMTNIKIIKIENLDGSITEHAIIDHGNEQFTSMLKSTYDEQQEHLQTRVPQVDETSAE